MDCKVDGVVKTPLCSGIVAFVGFLRVDLSE